MCVVVAVTVSTGCGRIGFVSSAEQDATIEDAPNNDAARSYVDPPMPNGGFVLAGILSGTGDDPQLRSGGLELWHAQDTSDWNLFYGVRASSSDLFSASLADAQNSSAEEIDPTMSADGMVLTFASNRGGVWRAYQATRTDLASPLTSPVRVPGLEDTVVHTLDLSPDGLVLHFVQFDQILWRAQRPDRTQPFGAVAIVDAPSGSHPSVSEDELELFMNGQGGARYATRIAKDQPFVTFGPLVVEGCSNPANADFVSATELVVVCAGIKLMTR